MGNLSTEEILELGIIHELIHVNDIEGIYDDHGKRNPTLNSVI